jgi:hypothetical protein
MSISCDSREWIIPLSDSQRFGIVRKGPIRPELSNEEYTKDEKSRHSSTYNYNIILKKADILVPITTT